MKNIELRDNLGFFFSCYRETEAVNFCIQNIRTFYENNPIYVSSDGGLDMAYLEKKDSKIKFRLYNDVLGYVNHPENKDKEILIDCCLEFLNRFYDAIEFCQTEYIIYYEPDILLRGHIKIHGDLDINGSYANTIHENVLYKINQYNPYNQNTKFGACGGSIIKSATFENVVKKTNRDLIAELVYTDPRISNCDYLLVVLFSIHGYNYLRNEDFIEAKRESWENTTHSIVHQYHEYYRNEYIGKYNTKL